MSRPEEPPHAAASPKRRAASAQPDDDTAEAREPVVATPDAQQDVDMFSATLAGDDDDESTLPGRRTPDRAGKGTVRELVVEQSSPSDTASMAIQLDNDTDDYTQLLGAEPDTASIEETQVGSEYEDNVARTTNRVNDVDLVEEDLQKELEQASGDHGEEKVAGRNDSSTTNSCEGESDSKTADTVATSTSLDPSGKNGKDKPVATASSLHSLTCMSSISPCIGYRDSEEQVKGHAQRSKQPRAVWSTDSWTILQIWPHSWFDWSSEPRQYLLHELGSSVHQKC